MSLFNFRFISILFFAFGVIVFAGSAAAQAPLYNLKWGSLGTGDGQFQNPRGVAVDGSGNVYVADGQNSRIQKFSSDGTFITKWGSFGSGTGNYEFRWAIKVAVDSSGNVYVLDTIEVQKFTSGGTFVT